MRKMLVVLVYRCRRKERGKKLAQETSKREVGRALLV